MSWVKTIHWVKRRTPRQRLAVLFLLLVFSMILLRYTQLIPTVRPMNASVLPQEYMKMVELTTYDTTGSLKNALYADYWAYSPQTEHSVLNRPKLVVYKPESVWEIVANQAKVSQPNIGAIENIALTKNVVLQSTPLTADNDDIVTVETEALDYQPEKQYAETTQFVKMTKPALTITGTGLRAFLENNWVELLHDVKTYYTSH